MGRVLGSFGVVWAGARPAALESRGSYLTKCRDPSLIVPRGWPRCQNPAVLGQERPRGAAWLEKSSRAACAINSPVPSGRQ